MPRIYRVPYQCPFYKKSLPLSLHCEGADITFPDVTAARDHVCAFCANEFGWRKCSVAIMLQRYYDRKEDGEDGKSN